MEAYRSTLDPAEKGGEVLRPTVLDPKDMNEFEVRSLESIHWDVSASKGAVASCLILIIKGEVSTLVRRVFQAELGAGLRAWEVLHNWYRPKSAVGGRHFHSWDHRTAQVGISCRPSVRHHGLGL